MRRRRRRLKKKVKRILYFTLILFLIIFIMIRLFSVNKTTTKNNNNTTSNIKNNNKNTSNISELEKLCKKMDYCNNEYMKRYEIYKDNNTNIDLVDVITRVNLNLDYKFYTHTKEATYLNKYYILVNKYNYLDKDYVPNNLEIVPEEYARSGMRLEKEAKDAFVEMARAAIKDDKKIIVMSSYRSYKYQDNLYNKYVESDGEDVANTYSAKAGFSEHQTGLCADIYDGVLDYTNFEKSDSFKWMQDNAYKYGFILRYPKEKEHITGYQYESWHYRYVGKKIAKYIYENNITFDEYYVRFIEGKY